MTNDLTDSERYVLRWLADSEFSQFGECKGASLDALIARGWVVVHPPGMHQDGFIARGMGDDYRAVSLTESGRAAARDLPND